MYTHLSETVPQPPEVLLPCEPYPTLKDCVTRTGDQAHGAARVIVICSTRDEVCVVVLYLLHNMRLKYGRQSYGTSLGP
jgi:hypothetical protein